MSKEPLYPHIPNKSPDSIELGYDRGVLIKVGNIMIQTAIIGREWAIDYIEVPLGEKNKYRDILLKAHIKIIKVMPEHIYFEGN